jgi:hypothetical protein
MTSAEQLKQIEEIHWPPFELEPRDLHKVNEILFAEDAPTPDTAEDRAIIKLREVVEAGKTDSDALENAMWVMEDYKAGRLHNPARFGWTPLLVSAGLAVVGVVGFCLGYRERKRSSVFQSTFIPPS